MYQGNNQPIDQSSMVQQGIKADDLTSEEIQSVQKFAGRIRANIKHHLPEVYSVGAECVENNQGVTINVQVFHNSRPIAGTQILVDDIKNAPEDEEKGEKQAQETSKEIVAQTIHTVLDQTNGPHQPQGS